MGSIMAYGAYMAKDQDIFSNSTSVASLDTMVAIIAGIAIFPIIFAFNLEPNSGPGLVFVSMLSAFNQMQFGYIIFRLDTGFKTHNPALEKSKRWLTELQLKKANVTIGINYPF